METIAQTPLAEQNKKLQKSLMDATGKLAEQDNLLSQLLAEPFVFGTVVEVSDTKPVREMFETGDLCLVIDEASNFYRNTGRVVDLPGDDGVVSLKMTGGDIANFTIGMPGLGAPQLKLLGKDDGKSVLVHTREQLYSLMNRPELQLIPGDVVKLSPKTMQIIDRSHVVPSGDVCRVKTVLQEGAKVEVEAHGHSKVVFAGFSKGNLEVGDRVSLDPAGVVVVHKLPAEYHDQYRVREETIGVSWDQIGGCEVAKDELIEALELPFRYPEVYSHYNKSQPKGALLYGPPGCGKTLLAKAAYASLAAIHGRAAVQSGFIYVKGPELLKRYVGDSEESLRSCFVLGEKHYAKHGFPALLFIDEAEAMFRTRGSGVSSDITDNMVTTFLSEMSGLNASHVMVLLATNQPKMLDSAVLRDGRCDRHIKVPRPDINVVPDIFDIYLKNVPLAEGFEREEAIALATAEVFSGRLGIYTIQANGSGELPFTLGDCVNGAMINGIVDKATSLAMKRDMREGSLTGVHPKELIRAVHLTYRQNRDINHDLNLIDFAERHGLDPSHLRPEPFPAPELAD